MYLSNSFRQLEGSFLPFIYMESGVLFITVNVELSDSSLMLDLL